jgi:antitoxin MazE
MNTKIKKWGNSLGVRIPKEILENLGIKEGFEVEVIEKGRSIELKPVYKNNLKKKYTLDELLAGMDKNNRPELIDWGPSVGKEIIEPWEGPKF